jgi:MinD-like ATPase involved in chromosome partitioning or flagellar assembly
LDALHDAVRELSIKLVVNMARDAKEERQGQVIGEVCRRFLNIEVTPIGTIPLDPGIERWAARMDTGSLHRDHSEGALSAIYEIAYALLTQAEQQSRAA